MCEEQGVGCGEGEGAAGEEVRVVVAGGGKATLVRP